MLKKTSWGPFPRSTISARGRTRRTGALCPPARAGAARGPRPTVRAYAYLKSFPGIEEHLGILQHSGWSMIAVADHVSDQLIQRLAGSNVSIQTSPIDLGHAARECDFAITNGSHGVTAALLLAGKPLLQIPLFVEQFLVADRVQKLGAGILIPPSNIAAFEGAYRA